jgi:CRISPR-associated protein Csd2
MTAIQNRYEFVYLFDVANGNPNGDPDAGNQPRLEPDTGRGLVTDVCLKRKVRNYVHMLGKPKSAIFIQERIPLNPRIAEAFEKNDLPSHRKSNGGWDTTKAKNRSVDETRIAQKWLCEHYFDVRAFGGVMSTGPNAGQIRGPVQLSFGVSVDPVVPVEVTITRLTDVDKEEGEMGRKYIVPYALYRSHGFISAHLAGDEKRGTGFSEEDLSLLWDALKSMFEHDRSAARGEMAARRLIVFKHKDKLGNAPAHNLFETVAIKRASGSSAQGAPRGYGDYIVTIDHGSVPKGVDVVKEADIA